MSQAWYMPHGFRQGDGRVSAAYSLIRVPESPQRHTTDCLATHCCIVTSVGECVRTVFLGFVDGETLSHVVGRRSMVTQCISAGPGGVMRLHPQGRIVKPVGNLEQFAGNFMCQSRRVAGIMDHP